jgi:chemosensory pili system protein ChpC
MHTPANDIRGVLIQVAGARLLLPNATIAEVLSYADPEPVDEAPSWLLGRIRWRGWQVPLVSFARFSGTAADEAGDLGSKVLVLKALGGDPALPHFALLTQGFPRLVTVSRQGLVADGGHGGDGHDDALPPGVQVRVLLNDDAAFIPDIGAVEGAVRGALANAA